MPDDVKLLDMLVFIGEPLPIMKDGAEVIPPAEEAEGSAADEPFIRVKLREHEGHRADKPFSVAPAQQVRHFLSWVTSLPVPRMHHFR